MFGIESFITYANVRWSRKEKGRDFAYAKYTRILNGAPVFYTELINSKVHTNLPCIQTPDKPLNQW